MRKLIAIAALVLTAQVLFAASGVTPPTGGSSGSSTGGVSAATATNIANAAVNTASNLTASGSQSLNMDRAVNLHRALTTNSRVRLGWLSDSLVATAAHPLARVLRSTDIAGTNGGVLGGGVDGAMGYTASGATNMLPGTTVGASNWMTGYFDFGSADTLTFSGYGGSNLYANRLTVAFIANGGGVWKLQTNVSSGTFADCGLSITNNAGSYSARLTNIVVPAGLYNFRIVGVSGKSSILFGGFQNTNGNGPVTLSLDLYGSSWGSFTNVATNVLSSVLGAWAPDAIFVEENSDAATWGNMLQHFDRARAQWGTNTDWLFMGTGPTTNSLVGIQAQNALTRAYALTNGLLYFDGYSTLTLTQMLRLGGDGIHPSTAANTVVAGQFLKQSGILENPGITRDVRSLRPVTAALTNGANAFTGEQTVNGQFSVKPGLADYFYIYDDTTASASMRLKRSSGVTYIWDEGAAVWQFSNIAGDARFAPTVGYSTVPDLGGPSQWWDQGYILFGNFSSIYAPTNTAPYRTLQHSNTTGIVTITNFYNQRATLWVKALFYGASNGIPSLNIVGTNRLTTNYYGLLSPRWYGNQNLTNHYTYRLTTNEVITFTDNSSGGTTAGVVEWKIFAE